MHVLKKLSGISIKKLQLHYSMRFDKLNYSILLLQLNWWNSEWSMTWKGHFGYKYQFIACLVKNIRESRIRYPWRLKNYVRDGRSYKTNFSIGLILGWNQSPRKLAIVEVAETEALVAVSSCCRLFQFSVLTVGELASLQRSRKKWRTNGTLSIRLNRIYWE